MFDQLETEHHNCWFDNLYLPARFVKAAITQEQDSNLRSDSQEWQGSPKICCARRKNKSNRCACSSGTVKGAVLEVDSEIPDLVAMSYYDQKPVHFLSTICESIKWIQCEKPVYCVEPDQVETLKFLHLNINNDYNHDMGGVDIADQLGNYYRFDHWMRKHKWWWLIFFWALGVLLVNTYMAYKTYMVSIGKQPMSHYNFCKAIALAWIDPATYWPDRMKKICMLQEQWMTETQTPSASSNSERNDVSTLSSDRSSWSCKRSVSSSGSMQTNGIEATKKEHAIPVNNMTLCPWTGMLWHRLNVHRGAHIPMASENKEPKRALHSWGANTKNRTQILKCGTCGIHLCLECVGKFHTVPEVEDLGRSFNLTSLNDKNIIEQANDIMGL